MSDKKLLARRAANQRRWRKAHPERAQKTLNSWRARNRGSLYGLNTVSFRALVKAQQGCCLICQRKTSDLCIDHDHRTGNVRGLLCRKCNLGIGLLLDSPALLTRAVKYLKGR
jgi:hypothetical protein